MNTFEMMLFRQMDLIKDRTIYDILMNNIRDIIRVFTEIEYDSISVELTNSNSLFFSLYIGSFMVDVDLYSEKLNESGLISFMMLYENKTMIYNKLIDLLELKNILQTLEIIK